jgi:hypothetical protein
VEFVFDADAIIKLHRAGVLQAVASTLDCIVPGDVINEVVVQGKARGYLDALEIEGIVPGGMAVSEIDASRVSSVSLGSGEMAVLGVLRNNPQGVAVSDDRPLLNVLSREGLPYLTPAGVIVLMVGRSILSVGEAKVALERLRPAIRENVYGQAIEELARLERES